MKDDSVIIEMFLSRCEEAIDCVSEKFGGYCFAVANNILNDRETSEECLNDTWFAAWCRIPPQIPKCLRVFLSKITRNIALTRYNAERRQKRGGGETALALDELQECVSSGSSGPEENLIESEEADLINQFLYGLKEKERDIFIQRYYYLYPMSKIAEYHGMKENYLRTLLSRTRAKLKDYLAERNYII